MDIEKARLTDEVANHIYTDWNKDSGYSWENLPEHRKEVYREWVKQYAIPIIIEDYKARLKGKVKQLGNPYKDNDIPLAFRTVDNLFKYRVFEEARQAILQLIEEE